MDVKISLGVKLKKNPSSVFIRVWRIIFYKDLAMELNPQHKQIGHLAAVLGAKFPDLSSFLIGMALPHIRLCVQEEGYVLVNV